MSWVKMIDLGKIKLDFKNRMRGLISIVLGLVTYDTFTNSAQALTCIDFSITPVSFGVYDSSSGSNLTTSGGVTINKFYDCLTAQLVSMNFTVKLSPGGSGTYSSRKMTNLLNPSSPLYYNLYVSGGSGAAIWGDGSGGSSVVNQTGSRNLNIPIYGVVPSKQNPSIGRYSDSVTMTIEYN
jgi:spore coat protein U-like protein